MIALDSRYPCVYGAQADQRIHNRQIHKMHRGGTRMDKLTLDLSRHCVETEIKKHYNLAISQYFRAKSGRAQLEQIIDLTQQALQTLDFNHLRSRYAPLAGQTDAEVELLREQDRLSILIDGDPVDLS
jgi:hypothetical protein